MNATGNPPPLISPEDAARILGFHVGHVRRLFQTGRLGGVKLGRALRFKPQHIEAFVNAGEVEASRKEMAA